MMQSFNSIWEWANLVDEKYKREKTPNNWKTSLVENNSATKGSLNLLWSPLEDKFNSVIEMKYFLMNLALMKARIDMLKVLQNTIPVVPK